MAIEYVGDKHIPVKTLLLMLLVGVIGLKWADTHWITTAVASGMETKLVTMIAANTTLLTAHLKEYDKNERKKAKQEVAKKIERIQGQQYSLKQFESVNGPNEMTADRQEELRRALKVQEGIQACMRANGVECD